MGDQLYLDPATGKLVVTSASVPTLDEIMQDPEKYPGYVLTMDYEGGRMEVLPKAEAKRRTDRQVVKRMAADGFFQPLKIQAMGIHRLFNVSG